MEEERELPSAGWHDALLLKLTHWSAILGGVMAVSVAAQALILGQLDVRHPAFWAMYLAWAASG